VKFEVGPTAQLVEDRKILLTAAHRVSNYVNGYLVLQRHFSALTKFAHVESRVCGRKR
jgi:hypothetical protein